MVQILDRRSPDFITEDQTDRRTTVQQHQGYPRKAWIRDTNLAFNQDDLMVLIVQDELLCRAANKIGNDVF